MSLVSKMGVRYEGVLYSVDRKESTISLARGEHRFLHSCIDNDYMVGCLVRSFGTEDRQVLNQIPPCDLIFDHIVFKASDIKDLMVCELPSGGDNRQSSMFNDPAIVSFSSAPPRSEPPMSMPFVGGGSFSSCLLLTYHLCPVLVAPSLQRSVPVTRDIYGRGMGKLTSRDLDRQ
jgi:protein LSM14